MLLACMWLLFSPESDSVANKKVVVYDAYRLQYASCLRFYLYRTYTKNPKMDVGRNFPPIVRGRTLVLPPQYQMWISTLSWGRFACTRQSGFSVQSASLVGGSPSITIVAFLRGISATIYLGRASGLILDVWITSNLQSCRICTSFGYFWYILYHTGTGWKPVRYYFTHLCYYDAGAGAASGLRHPDSCHRRPFRPLVGTAITVSGWGWNGNALYDEDVEIGNKTQASQYSHTSYHAPTPSPQAPPNRRRVGTRKRPPKKTITSDREITCVRRRN
jgi:hypothetical protein